MNNCFKICLVFLVLLSITSCLAKADTEVRIQNTSQLNFQSVAVGFPDQLEQYGALSRGALSGYRKVTSAYRYAYIEVRVNGEKFELRPKDYVGETLLPNGQFTYALDLDPKLKSINLTLIESKN